MDITDRSLRAAFGDGYTAVGHLPAASPQTLSPACTSFCVVCNTSSSKKCKACGLAHYCSAEHQKEDWQDHKFACKMLMKDGVVIPTQQRVERMQDDTNVAHPRPPYLLFRSVLSEIRMDKQWSDIAEKTIDKARTRLEREDVLVWLRCFQLARNHIANSTTKSSLRDGIYDLDTSNKDMHRGRDAHIAMHAAACAHGRMRAATSLEDLIPVNIEAWNYLIVDEEKHKVDPMPIGTEFLTMARAGRANICIFLAELGVNPHVRSINGDTALDLARSSKRSPSSASSPVQAMYAATERFLLSLQVQANRSSNIQRRGARKVGSLDALLRKNGFPEPYFCDVIEFHDAWGLDRTVESNVPIENLMAMGIRF